MNLTDTAKPNPPPGEISLIITLGPQGLKIMGPVQDRLFCYGMLELARDAIRDSRPENHVLPVSLLPPRIRPPGSG